MAKDKEETEPRQLLIHPPPPPAGLPEPPRQLRPPPPSPGLPEHERKNVMDFKERTTKRKRKRGALLDTSMLKKFLGDEPGSQTMEFLGDSSMDACQKVSKILGVWGNIEENLPLKRGGKMINVVGKDSWQIRLQRMEEQDGDGHILKTSSSPSQMTGKERIPSPIGKNKRDFFEESNNEGFKEWGIWVINEEERKNPTLEFKVGNIEKKDGLNLI